MCFVTLSHDGLCQYVLEVNVLKEVIEILLDEAGTS